MDDFLTVSGNPEGAQGVPDNVFDYAVAQFFDRSVRLAGVSRGIGRKSVPMRSRVGPILSKPSASQK
jgi:hypothetical protein